MKRSDKRRGHQAARRTGHSGRGLALAGLTALLLGNVPVLGDQVYQIDFNDAAGGPATGWNSFGDPSAITGTPAVLSDSNGSAAAGVTIVAAGDIFDSAGTNLWNSATAPGWVEGSAGNDFFWTDDTTPGQLRTFTVTCGGLAAGSTVSLEVFASRSSSNTLTAFFEYSLDGGSTWSGMMVVDNTGSPAAAGGWDGNDTQSRAFNLVADGYTAGRYMSTMDVVLSASSLMVRLAEDSGSSYAGINALRLTTPGTFPPPEPGITVLFVGNSYTHGSFDPLLHYNSGAITDLNGTGYGGLPGMFKQMTVSAGLDYDVAIEAVSSKTLAYHLSSKSGLIFQPQWDHVILQEQSRGTLPAEHGGDLEAFQDAVIGLEQGIHAANPDAKVVLYETFPRADLIYESGGAYYGESVEAMVADLHSGHYGMLDLDPNVTAVSPAGDAWLEAILAGVADRNPLNGIDAGKVNLWAADNHHASAYGCFLNALVHFGTITGIDPRTLGYEQTAMDLGISSSQALNLQQVAYDTLTGNAAQPVISAPGVADGLFTFTISNMTAGRIVTIERTHSLTNGPWIPVHSFTASGPTADYSDPVPVADSGNFYRVVW